MEATSSALQNCSGSHELCRRKDERKRLWVNEASAHHHVAVQYVSVKYQYQYQYQYIREINQT